MLGSNGNSQRRHSSVDEIHRFISRSDQRQRSLSDNHIQEAKIKGKLGRGATIGAIHKLHR